MSDLQARRFRVQNFRNVDDSGWIDLGPVTCLVGRNESGKTALLQALHKFNPASELPYSPQREYPRDRFQREFKDGSGIPVCSVEFAITGELRDQVAALGSGGAIPDTITWTRYYNEDLSYELNPSVPTPPLSGKDVEKALSDLAGLVRRITPPAGDAEGAFEKVRGDLLAWVAEARKRLPAGDLRNDAGRKLLLALEKEVEKFSNEWTADAIESFLPRLRELAEEAARPELEKRIEQLCLAKMPVFIYFEDYGILDSAVYLPRFIADLARTPDDSKIRTINAMFTHVGLAAQEVLDLGTDALAATKAEGKAPTPAQIRKEQERKELRAIKLNSASLDITKRFSGWWHQRRHQIRYHADGDYFRIWVADDRRPGVEIELESRSKGFQWFFSFYLVFLVESSEGHRDAVLLLDEPGLHLHGTAQQELLGFFDELAEKNKLIYTTHLPFLIDGRRLDRVRTVMETPDGRSQVSSDIWPADRETIFPLQAALGYDLVQTLFQGRLNVLGEGLAELFYIYGMSSFLVANGRRGMPDDIFVTPSRGTKMMAMLASLFIGQGARPLVLLDDDDAGRVAKASLLKDLYAGEENSILLVRQAVPGAAEIEDVVGEPRVLQALESILGTKVVLAPQDQKPGGGVVDRIEAWSRRTGATLEDGWKVEVARRVVQSWQNGDPPASRDELDRAQALVGQIAQRLSARPTAGRAAPVVESQLATVTAPSGGGSASGSST